MSAERVAAAWSPPTTAMRSLAAAALALALAAAAYHRYAAMDYKRDFYLFGAPIQHSCVELPFVVLLPTSASLVLARQS